MSAIPRPVTRWRGRLRAARRTASPGATRTGFGRSTASSMRLCRTSRASAAVLPYDVAVMTSSNRIYLFDTTLRDGAQTQGVDFTVADKVAIARELDLLGVDYIEGGWPGANPTDDRFFADPPAFNNAKFVAFGMTRRAGRSAANDPGLAAILQTKARNVCMVGKTWDFHVDVALEVDRTEYLEMIADSLAYAK